MNWEAQVRLAEAKLSSSRIPGSQEIISLIKSINPTCLSLSESEKERGYQLKNELQNLLLENYGECFRLDRHPYCDNILLIRHRSIPTIDACHTHIRCLSRKALDILEEPSSVPVPAATKATPHKKKKNASPGAPAREMLSIAQGLLAEYDYIGAEQHLSGIRIRDRKELSTLVKALRILVEEMGAYQSAAASILAQPADVQTERQVRELLALTCYGREMIPEARALLEALRPDELGKSALFAYADISFRDGNLHAAMSVLKLAEAKEGVLPAESELRKKIEASMRAEAEPLLREAEPFFAAGELDRAEALVRQALAHYPHFQEARCLLRKVEAVRAEGDIQALWSQFENANSPQERLKPLAKLLELDRSSKGRITDLIEKEKAALKQHAVEERLHELRALAAGEEWPACFDILLWLSRQDEAERFEQACSITPQFSVLLGNRRLLKLSDQEAKETWLSFVAVKAQLATGDSQGCLERLEQMKPYFDRYPQFLSEYERLLEAEREAARAATKTLMMNLLCADSLATARGIAAKVRRSIARLSAEEAAGYRSTIAMALSYHSRGLSEEDALEDYRVALTIGYAAKAASLRESISDMDELASIDEELADYFKIDIEPITVVVQTDLSIGLATEPRSPLTFLGQSPHHVVFREAEDAIIVIDMKKMTAARYISPHFLNLGFFDSLPDRDHFLFANTVTCNNVWRAKLSPTEAHFCAEIVVSENYTYEAGATFCGMYMSSSKDNDYYAFIEEGDLVRVVKQSLDIVSTTVRAFPVKGEITGISRASYNPDALLIGSESGTFLLNSNLDIPHGTSSVARTIPMRLFAVDLDKLNIYIADNFIKVLNPKLRVIKQYFNATAGGFITQPGIKGICTTTDTALISLAPGRGTFYDLNSNKFSQTVPLGRVLWTDTPTRWHCFDYDKDSSTILIKDITDDLGTLLEWRVISTPEQDYDTQLVNISQFEDPAFFALPVHTPGQAEGT